MQQKLRDKYCKDTETARETIIDSSSFITGAPGNPRHNRKLKPGSAIQQAAENNFDNFIEKKN